MVERYETERSEWHNIRQINSTRYKYLFIDDIQFVHALEANRTHTATQVHRVPNEPPTSAHRMIPVLSKRNSDISVNKSMNIRWLNGEASSNASTLYQTEFCGIFLVPKYLPVTGYSSLEFCPCKHADSGKIHCQYWYRSI